MVLLFPSREGASFSYYITLLKKTLFSETLFAARTFDAAADLKTCFVVTLVKKGSNNNQVKPFPRPVVVCKPQVQSKEKVRITTHEKARER